MRKQCKLIGSFQVGKNNGAKRGLANLEENSQIGLSGKRVRTAVPLRSMMKKLNIFLYYRGLTSERMTQRVYDLLKLAES